MKQTAVEWLIEQIIKYRLVTEGTNPDNVLFHKAKEMEEKQKNNLPIHIHEGISNTHVYIEDGVVHVKPNNPEETDTKPPCNLDHNGECLICDCWISNCAYLRYLKGDYEFETKEELEQMFKKDE